jgi:hypothetical protein
VEVNAIAPLPILLLDVGKRAESIRTVQPRGARPCPSAAVLRDGHGWISVAKRV